MANESWKIRIIDVMNELEDRTPTSIIQKEEKYTEEENENQPLQV